MTEYLPCGACEARDPECPHCDGNGKIELIGCAWDQVDQDTVELVRAARLIKDGGGWPNNRGWANEPAAFVEGVRVVWNEFARIKNESMPHGSEC